MLFQLHEWDIHIVCRGAGGAGGAGGAAADDPPRQAGNSAFDDLYTALRGECSATGVQRVNGRQIPDE
jgi:hypothetical protein